MEIVERGTVTVTWTGEEYCFVGDGIAADFELSVPTLVDELFRRLFDRALAALSGHIRIGAACGSTAGKSFLIAGPKGAGKTVMALQLLLDGFDITGDALALLRSGEAVAYPRKFVLGEESVALVPALAKSERFASIARNPRAQRIILLDPGEFGKPWRISPARVAAIFYLEPNFGAARSILTPCPKVEMVRRLMPQCAPPASGRRDWLGDLCATVNQADSWVVALGDLPSASEAMAEVIARAQ